MDARQQTLFGEAGAAPASPGSYGEAPRGFRLPADTRLGTVRLQVADLARSVAFYERVLGLQATSRSTSISELRAQGDDRVLVELHVHPGARPVTRRGRLGLYHFAILVADRASLGRFVQHLADSGVQAGAGDHLVSEAFYLSDPDGLGIEVYADRPRSSWQRIGRELMMATDPVDVDDVVASAGGRSWEGMPAGTTIGHVHLHVGAIPKAAAFYSEALGFDRITWSYPGALFMSAGGYHHHLGTNTWAGPAAVAPADDEARLLEWTLEVPDATTVAAITESLVAAGFHADQGNAGTLVTRDPWGTTVRIVAAGP